MSALGDERLKSSIAFYRVEDILTHGVSLFTGFRHPIRALKHKLGIDSDQKSSGNLFGTTDYFSPYLDTTAAHNPKITYG